MCDGIVYSDRGPCSLLYNTLSIHPYFSCRVGKNPNSVKGMGSSLRISVCVFSLFACLWLVRCDSGRCPFGSGSGSGSGVSSSGSGVFSGSGSGSGMICDELLGPDEDILVAFNFYCRNIFNPDPGCESESCRFCKQLVECNVTVGDQFDVCASDLPLVCSTQPQIPVLTDLYRGVCQFAADVCLDSDESGICASRDLIDACRSVTGLPYPCDCFVPNTTCELCSSVLPLCSAVSSGSGSTMQPQPTVTQLPSTPTQPSSSQPPTQPSVSMPPTQPSSEPPTQPSSQPPIQPSVSMPPTQPSSEPPTQPSSQPPTQPSVSMPPTQPSSQPPIQPSVSMPPTQPSSQPPIQPSVSMPPTQPSSEPPTQPSSQPPIQPSVSMPPTQPSSEPPTQPSSQPPIQPSVSMPPTQPSSEPPTQPSSLPPSQPPTQPSSLPPTQPSSQPPTQPSSEPPTQPSTSLPPTQPSPSPGPPAFPVSEDYNVGNDCLIFLCT